MAQNNCPEPIPEGEGRESANSGTPCPACRGRGRKFTTLRRLVGAAGGASEDELLKKTQADCLHCSGSGRAATGMTSAAQAGD
jgi:hypothetical protein